MTTDCGFYGRGGRTESFFFSAISKGVNEIYEERCIYCKNLLFAKIKKSDKKLSDLEI